MNPNVIVQVSRWLGSLLEMASACFLDCGQEAGRTGLGCCREGADETTGDSERSRRPTRVVRVASGKSRPPRVVRAQPCRWARTGMVVLARRRDHDLRRIVGAGTVVDETGEVTGVVDGFASRDLADGPSSTTVLSSGCFLQFTETAASLRPGWTHSHRRDAPAKSNVLVTGFPYRS